jgi:hypothetical protein
MNGVLRSLGLLHLGAALGALVLACSDERTEPNGAASGAGQHAGAGGELPASSGGASDGTDRGGSGALGDGGEALAGDGGAISSNEGGAGGGAATDCIAPFAPVLEHVHPSAVLSFTAKGVIEIGQSDDPEAMVPASWSAADEVTLPASGTVKIFARTLEPGCDEHAWFSHVYRIVEEFAGAAGSETSTAIGKDDAGIVGWAQGYSDLSLGSGSTNPDYQDPKKALGPAVGDSFDVISLGDGGSITMHFDPPLADGPGYDLAVFENGFGDQFLELGFVEVSSDGETFVRFDSSYRGDAPVSAFGMTSPAWLEGLAGKYRQGYGTPFDLNLLRFKPEVQSGEVDLARIAYVRVVDIIGDGSAEDAFGRTIYDPHPTTQTAGFDLDAIAALNIR